MNLACANSEVLSSMEAWSVLIASVVGVINDPSRFELVFWSGEVILAAC
jgi:hypothetical protein